MSKPKNTTRLVEERFARGDPSVLLETFPGMIEASEVRGQAELVMSESLPTSFGLFNDDDRDKHRALLESWGFRLGEPYPDDDLFMPAQLPEGWAKQSTDHAMWSNVLDAKGRERIHIFYKAAFYDRRASMRICPRYDIDYAEVSKGASLNEDVVVHTIVDRQTGEKLAAFQGRYETSSDEARAFLKAKIGDADNASLWTE